MNRIKLIAVFIANISNAVVHDILEISINSEELRKHYDMECSNFIKISKFYRDKINPAELPLPSKDAKKIRGKIKRNVFNELNLRISNGYQNIDLGLVDEHIDKRLKEMKVT